MHKFGFHFYAERIAFFSVANQSLLATKKVSFMANKLNYADGYNIYSGQTFTCPKAGIYWLFFSIVWDGTTYANFSVQGTNEPVLAIQRLHTVFNNYDTISRDKMFNLTINQQLIITSAFPTYADVTIGSSWGAFLLGDLMSPLIAFEVYASTTIQAQANCFDTVVFNYGNAWEISSQTFTAPVSGTYYFSLSIGVSANVDGYNRIGSYDVCEIEMYDSSHNGIDLVSGACLINLTVSQTFTISWYSPSSGYDSSYKQTSLRGFLYSPVHGKQIAWSVHSSDTVSGSGSAMHFPNVLVNTPAFIWQSSSNSLTVPVSGLYYMDITGQTSGNHGIIDMRLTLNSTVNLTRLYCASAVTFVTRSRSLMAHLLANSILAVAYDNVNLEGYGINGFGFQGFLIYPD